MLTHTSHPQPSSYCIHIVLPLLNDHLPAPTCKFIKQKNPYSTHWQNIFYYWQASQIKRTCIYRMWVCVCVWLFTERR